MAELMSDGGVSRTAPATPGLLIRVFLYLITVWGNSETPGYGISPSSF